jgi:hypothetical protein
MSSTLNDLVDIKFESGNHISLNKIIIAIEHPTKLVDLKFCRFSRKMV